MAARKCFIALQKKIGKIGNNSEISEGHVSVKDYLVCKKIWNKFDMKNMADYHYHYLKKDEKSIVTCLNLYGLDPCHYFSSPGLIWDAMLKMTGVKLEKILDIDTYLFIEKGLRGGVS